MVNPEKKIGIYNVGTGEATSFKVLCSYIFKSLNIKEKYNWIEMPEELKDQYQYFTKAELNNLRNSLAYRKEFLVLEDSVSDYVKKYLMAMDSYL